MDTTDVDARQAVERRAVADDEEQHLQGTRETERSVLVTVNTRETGGG